MTPWTALAATLAFAVSLAAQVRPPEPPAGISIDGTLWALFIDDLHLDFRQTGRLRETLRQIVRELYRDGDLVAVKATGPSAVALGRTADLLAIDRKITKVSGAGFRPSEVPVPDARPELSYRAHIALSTASDVVSGMARIGARNRVLVYVSSGYWLEDEPVIPPASERRSNLPQATRSDLANLADQARRANVAIFAIDPRGLAGPAPIDPADTEWLKATQTSLEWLSSATEGFAILDIRELERHLATISRSVR